MRKKSVRRAQTTAQKSDGMYIVFFSVVWYIEKYDYHHHS